jgi:LmbE family N-acetylglucosaminyl deacetylase
MAIHTDFSSLGTILGIWAHPDDETFSSAGIMMSAVSNGQTVALVHATKGEAGIQDESRWPADKLGAIRAEELAQALSIYDVSEQHWLDYADGGCKDVPEADALPRLRQYVEQYMPDSILTFGPEGMTGHDDHCAVSRWVSRLAEEYPQVTVYHAVQLREDYEAGLQISDQFNFFFNIDQPPLVEADECEILFKLPDDLLIKKYQALFSMPSQYEAMCQAFGQDAICRLICNEAFVKAKRRET